MTMRVPGGSGADDGTIASLSLAAFHQFDASGSTTKTVEWTTGSAEEALAMVGVFKSVVVGGGTTIRDIIMPRGVIVRPR